MGKIAIAGAGGNVASHIIKAVVDNGKHSIVALTRSPNDGLAKLARTTVKVVNYTDVSGLISALQGCDTVISTIFDPKDEEGSLVGSQLNLIKAAKEAGVKRFSPADYGIHNDAIKIMKRQEMKQAAVEEAKRLGLETTVFQNGIFMNYLCAGSPKQDEGLAGVKPVPTPWIDPINGKAFVFGDGTANVTITDVRDVGRFVAAALDLDKWPAQSGMAGTTITFEGVVELAEKVTGRKLERTYLSVEQLQELSKQSGPMGHRFQAVLANALGLAEVPPTLNNLCPEVSSIDLEVFLEKYWGYLRD